MHFKPCKQTINGICTKKKCAAQLFIYNYLTEVIRSQVRKVFWEGGCESKYWKINQAELGCLHSDFGQYGTSNNLPYCLLNAEFEQRSRNPIGKT